MSENECIGHPIGEFMISPIQRKRDAKKKILLISDERYNSFDYGDICENSFARSPKSKNPVTLTFSSIS